MGRFCKIYVYVVPEDGLETEGYAAGSSADSAGNVYIERVLLVYNDTCFLELGKYSFRSYGISEEQVLGSFVVHEVAERIAC